MSVIKILLAVIGAAVFIAPTILALVSMSKTDLLIAASIFVVGIAVIVLASFLGEWSGRRAGERKARRILSERRAQQQRRQQQREREPEPEPAAEAPLPRKRTWRTALGFREDETPSMRKVRSVYLRLAKSAHPDAGGTHAQMVKLNAALDAARRELQKGRHTT